MLKIKKMMEGYNATYIGKSNNRIVCKFDYDDVVRIKFFCYPDKPNRLVKSIFVRYNKIKGITDKTHKIAKRCFRRKNIKFIYSDTYLMVMRGGKNIDKIFFNNIDELVDKLSALVSKKSRVDFF